jgi:hypothetical protein
MPDWFKKAIIEALVIVLRDIFTHQSDLPTPPPAP